MAKTNKAQSGWYIRWLVLIPIPLLWCVIAQMGFLKPLENRLLDLRFRLRGEVEAPGVKLIYVDIDTPAIEILGSQPWPRGVFAKLAEVLLQKGAAQAVGFDFVFSNVGRSSLVDEAMVKEGNVEFAKVSRAYPKKVVLAAQYTPGESVREDGTFRRIPLLRKGFVDRSKNSLPEMPEAPLNHPAANARFGLIDVDVEYSGDEVPRWVPLFAYTLGPTLYHMSLQLVLQHFGLDERAIKIEKNFLELVRPDGTQVARIPLTENQLLEANWFSRWKNSRLNPRYSAHEVFFHRQSLASRDAKERREAEEFFAQFKNSIVLVGPVDPLLQDLAPTPFDSYPVPKVGLHGNLVKTIISGKYLHRLPPWSVWVAVFGLTAIVTVLALVGGAKGKLAKAGALAALLGYVGACVFFFSRLHLILPMGAPIGAAFSTSFVAIVWQLVVEEMRAGRIKGMFGAYVSPQLVERMVESGEDPKLGGHEEQITAYFSDIQSFSAFSEKLPPSKLVELMNEYLTACTDIVQEQGGTLDKYIGDAVVAMFGAPIVLPDHALRACVATQLVHRRLAELREKWKSEGDTWPEIVWKMQSRIGLNSGPAVIGNMGSRTRFNYTMMGDNVNLAARMESGAKSWGAYTMVTEATKQACEQHGGDRVVFRPLGSIVVMGRSQPVPIFEIVGLKESLPSSSRECIGVFSEGLAKYYARDWDGAISLFRRSKELEPNQPGKTPGVKTNPSLVYLRIAEEYKLEPPPATWDGVYVMKEK